MVRRSRARRRLAERAFRFQVEVTVPGHGLGLRLNRMIRWCRRNCGRGSWDWYAVSAVHRSSDIGDNICFYFGAREQAEAFQKQFLQR